MRGEKTICIGLAGAGYAAWLHGNAYQRIAKVPVCLKTVADIDKEKADNIREKFGFEFAADNIDAILKDPEIDVLDIATPPILHAEMIKKGLEAGKHVICEKPLLGYLGSPGDEKPIGKKISKSIMYKKVVEDLDSLKKIIDSSDRSFFYAENYVYAAPLQKMSEIITKRKSKILYIKAFTALSGSSSPLAGQWDKTGGGCFIRNGVHPLTGILWLKQIEAKARGEEITVTSVSADMSVSTDCLSEYEHRHIDAKPVDVEDNAVVNIKFSDGTGAVIFASDTRLGGTRNSFDVYCNDAALECNLTPTDMLNTFFLDEEGMNNVQLAERLSSIRGWNKAFISDDVIRGHAGELQHFMESVAFGKKPATDFELAALTIKLIYAAYLSAEEGRRQLI